MTTPHKYRPHLIIALSLTTASALVGATLWYGHATDNDTRVATSSPASPEALSGEPIQRPAEPGNTPAQVDQPALAKLELRLDGSTRLVDQSKTHKAASGKQSASVHGVDAKAAGSFVENDPPTEPLDLKVPSSLHEETTRAAAKKAVAASAAEPNPLDVSEFRPAAPKVESYNLFKPEYGLRGFMKQGWINQRVALQGGLGLNDDRLINTDTDFRDDIAFGMGLIVAF